VALGYVSVYTYAWFLFTFCCLLPKALSSSLPAILRRRRLYLSAYEMWPNLEEDLLAVLELYEYKTARLIAGGEF
jgi:hypothetical protein